MDLKAVLGFPAELPGIAGQFSGRLLIVGGARCVWDDIAQLPGGRDALAKWRGGIMAVNDIGCHIHRDITHWATLHGEYMAGWLAYRLGHNYGDRGHVYTHGAKSHAGIQNVWNMQLRGGSSGLFAAILARLLGYEEIVLAGMPIDGQGHYYDPPWLDLGQFGRADHLEWEWARDNVFAGRVKSLSGHTKLLLGAP